MTDNENTKPSLRKDHNPKVKLKEILSRCVENNGCLEWTGVWIKYRTILILMIMF